MELTPLILDAMRVKIARDAEAEKPVDEKYLSMYFNLLDAYREQKADKQ